MFSKLFSLSEENKQKGSPNYSFFLYLFWVHGKINIRHFNTASEAFVRGCTGQKVKLTMRIFNMTENIWPKFALQRK